MAGAAGMRGRRLLAVGLFLILLVPGTGIASEFFTRERPSNTVTNLRCQIIFDPALCGANVIEGHTTYRVVANEDKTINTVHNEHNFSAVAGFAKHIRRQCAPQVFGQNGVLWFNDQRFIDPGANDITNEPCVVTEECSAGCYVIGVTAGSPDPGASNFAGAVQRFVYQYSDPNGIAWETREYFGGGRFFWVVTIGSTTTDAATNLPGGTTNRGSGSSPQLNTAKGTPTGANNTYVNGCTGADAPSIPECYQGGTDHNPTGDGSNPRQYNFVVLVDMVGSPQANSPSVNKLSGINAMGTSACTASASDDGASHASQGMHIGGCPHTHRQASIDLWFSHTQPAATGGTIMNFGSTFAYHT